MPMEKLGAARGVSRPLHIRTIIFYTLPPTSNMMSNLEALQKDRTHQFVLRYGDSHEENCETCMADDCSAA